MSGNRDLLYRTDWASTALGPLESWPPRMRAVVEMAMDSGFPVATVWGEDAIQVYNDAYNRMYGDKHPGAFGRPMRESWEEIWDFLEPAFDRVTATGEPLWFHDSLLPLARHGAPEECWFDFSYSVVRDEDGQSIGMVSIAVEKTQGVVLGRRMKACDLPLDTMLEGGLDGLSRALRERLSENPMDAAAARLIRLGGDAGETETLLWTLGEASAADAPHWSDLPLSNRRGTIVARLELLAHPLVPRESHAAFVTMLSDRLHRIVHHAEQFDSVQRQLLQQDQLYRFLFDSIGEAAVYSTTAGEPGAEESILAANPAASQLLGYSQDELVGMSREQLFYPGNEALQQALAVRYRERAFSGELVFRRKDGQPLAVEVSSRLVQTQEGHFRAVSLLRDVSARTVRESERAAQARFEAIAQLTGGIAHDFNNLLTVVLGSLELLMDELPPEGRARSYASNALLCAERGASLTNQLLSYARRQPLRLQPVELESHLDELLPLVRSSLGEINQVELHRHGDLPRCASDLGQLTTALLNLATNARDAMPDGGTLRLSTDVVKAQVPGGARIGGKPVMRQFVRLSVTDTGRGVPVEIQERIFEPYFTTKGVGSGSGLGLSMVKGFVQQCGGDVRVSSTPGQGTTFELLFPVDERSPRPALPPKTLPERGSAILVVEDNELVRVQVCGLLVGAGFTVHQAANAREALGILEAGPLPALVLTDLVMPGGMSGMQLAHELRRRFPKLPVVVMTGHDPWAAARDERDQQFEIVAKPFDRATLLDVLARHLA